MEPPAHPTDWSELPSDVLDVVLRKLEFPDLFRSSAVCRSWRATGRGIHRDGQYTLPQTPCLLYTTAAAAGTGAVELYSLADKSTYAARLPDPPIESRYIIGSSHGWLVTADDRSELHLVNPVTGDQIALPSVTTIEHVRPVFNDAGDLDSYEAVQYRGDQDHFALVPYAMDSLREFLYLKAVLSSDPSRGDYTVMLMHHTQNQLSFARAGDDRWTWVKFNDMAWFADCIYHDGAFYVTTFTRAIHIITVSRDGSFTRRLIRGSSVPRFCNAYIVRTPDGDILQLLRSVADEPTGEIRTELIEVFKVDMEKQDPKTKPERVESLGDNAVFIGTSHSICLSVKDYPQLMPNHIYFDDDDEYGLRGKNVRRDVGVYDFEDDSVKDLVSPQPWLNWPPPIWITPSFTKLAK